VIFPIRRAMRIKAGRPSTPGFIKLSAHLSNGQPVGKNHSPYCLYRRPGSRNVFPGNRKKKNSTKARDQRTEPGCICTGSFIIEPRALLSVINALFKTDCHDPAAIDANGTWAIIVEELRPYYQSALTLAVRFHPGMKLSEAGKILGVSGTCVHQRCERAMRYLRDPRRIIRIQNSIVGLPNLYRIQNAA
jgi:hypothetical protein